MERSLKELDEVQSNCVMIGIDYDSLLNRDIRYYNNCVKGFISRREVQMNDAQTVGHIIAGKIAQGVWGNDSFGKQLDEIRLREDTREEKILRTLRAKGVI